MAKESKTKGSKGLIKLLQKAARAHRAYEDVVPQGKKLAQNIRVSAKRAIVAVRKGEDEQFDVAAKSAARDLKSLQQLARGSASALMSEGFAREALEEYAEAMLLRAIVANQVPEFSGDIKDDPEILISGLCDAVGEILRMAILQASQADRALELDNYRLLIERVILELAPVAHSGKLRQKYDEMERNQKRLESLIYEAKKRG
jgi:predicted translin family RNA/ssDNA-binding protein